MKDAFRAGRFVCQAFVASGRDSRELLDRCHVLPLGFERERCIATRPPDRRRVVSDFLTTSRNLRLWTWALPLSAMSPLPSQPALAHIATRGLAALLSRGTSSSAPPGEHPLYPDHSHRSLPTCQVGGTTGIGWRASLALAAAGILLAGCESLPLDPVGDLAATRGWAPSPAAAAAASEPLGAWTEPVRTGALPISAPASAPASAPLAAPAPPTVPDPTASRVIEHQAPAPTPLPPTAPPTGDVWDRLRRGFSVPALDHPLVDQHAAAFARTAFLSYRDDRLRLYLPLIVAELEARGLPLELAMLPLVESALNPQARSPVGALGTWQFMAPTARRFELRTSRLVDDRKNLRAATRAAMDYLQKLHAQFGDWHLAMAAYNWGEGRVQAAAARLRARGVPVGFVNMAPHMPDETRHYVPKIMALARLVAQPASYQAVLPDLPDGPALAEVALPRDMDLALALRWAGLPERSFLALNPAVSAPLLLASATPRLLLPEDAARRFEAGASAHRGPWSRWSVIKLPATTHLGALARQHGVSEAALRQANRIPAGMKPTAGSVLLLPVPPRQPIDVPAALVATAQLGMAPDLVKVNTRVRKKETLRDVARRCGVDDETLARWNGLSPRMAARRLPAGRWLSLWVLRDRAGQFAAAGERGRPPS